MDSIDHPDLIDAQLTGVMSGENWIRDIVPPEKFGPRVGFCSNVSHKYNISIDGNNATFLRSQYILASDSVPVIIESKFKPLYLDSWIPWVHYVPVQNDQSDLYEKIRWLQENDDKAK